MEDLTMSYKLPCYSQNKQILSCFIIALLSDGMMMSYSRTVPRVTRRNLYSLMTLYDLNFTKSLWKSMWNSELWNMWNKLIYMYLVMLYKPRYIYKIQPKLILFTSQTKDSYHRMCNIGTSLIGLTS